MSPLLHPSECINSTLLFIDLAQHDEDMVP